MTEEKLSFQAEVSRLLDLVANALYSNKEIFLRELISNASDACDRRRYAALTDTAAAVDDQGYRIVIETDKDAATVVITDNGIGMSRDELIADLGTIARSGTAAFVKQLESETADVSQIGQFGVGFYSAFMVADEVTVDSRKVGEEQAWRWQSDGKGAFTISESDKADVGTRIALKLKDDAAEFLDPMRIRRIVKTYSDHIAIPVVLLGDGEEETLNSASALWTRPKSEISDEQYKEFYHHVGHGFDEPWLRLHFKAEGVIEYTGLLFIPSSKPIDLFHPDRRHGVKLYVKRVFISDDCSGLVPPYLRFLRGVVDSEDLPLNISREMLQTSPMLTKIRSAVTKRVLSELEKKADKAPDEYATFYETFGAVLKEGIYEEQAQRDKLLELARFRTTHDDGWTSLKDYVGRMKEGQEVIYTISGENLDALKASPQLEGFAAKGVEVLLFTDPVDDFWVSAVPSYAEKPFRSATRGDADLSKVASADTGEDESTSESDEAAPAANLDALIAFIKLSLKDQVKDVRASERLTDSPVCLVADEGDLDMHLERILRQHRQVDDAAKRILEINPKHGLIRCLATRLDSKGAGQDLDEVAKLLLDQALILEGESLPDPVAFARRLSSFVEKGIAAQVPAT